VLARILMAKPRPTEIKLIAGLLDPESSDPDNASALAIEIIEALDKSRGKRDSYIVVGQLAPWAPVQTWGDFSTRNQAEKFLQYLSPADKGGEIRCLVSKLETAETLKKRIE
jgi:hypothetical protein